MARDALKLAHGRSGAHRHLGATVHVGEEIRDPLRERARQHAGQSLDHGDFLAEHGEGRRNLKPDEPASNDGNRLRLRHAGLERDRVVEGAQIEHALKVGPGDRQQARPATGRQSKPPVGQRAPVREGNRTACPVDRGRPHSQDRLDAVLLQHLLGADRQRALGDFAGEKPLRQRRSLIGQVALVADQHDRLRKPTAAGRQRDLQARIGRSDNDQRFMHDIQAPREMGLYRIGAGGNMARRGHYAPHARGGST